MKITVVYDNETLKETLKAGWGFSALIESEQNPPILFDTGADRTILLHNMKELNIDPAAIGIIVISHDHSDHTGGLVAMLRENASTRLYLPASLTGKYPDRQVTIVGKDSVQICPDVFSTGELENIEQSLALRTEKGIFALTGCSHSGVRNILKAASEFGTVYGIGGGFHGFNDFKALEGLSLIYPCHCTQHRMKIRTLFPDTSRDCGVGLVIEL